ncbi:hypothetical protein AGOR_G00238150 [Albula goreensis]|uniref:Uncharacterized protein n=1 Tax=Albula goreensis TaxID=1534307 RepID=A0A8T3CFW4_9TELE|nr:hypothetical protein AGOR_G00238150 [Albula goreensis]
MGDTSEYQRLPSDEEELTSTETEGRLSGPQSPQCPSVLPGSELTSRGPDNGAFPPPRRLCHFRPAAASTGNLPRRLGLRGTTVIPYPARYGVLCSVRHSG